MSRHRHNTGARFHPKRVPPPPRLSIQISLIFDGVSPEEERRKNSIDWIVRPRERAASEMNINKRGGEAVVQTGSNFFPSSPPARIDFSTDGGKKRSPLGGEWNAPSSDLFLGVIYFERGRRKGERERGKVMQRKIQENTGREGGLRCISVSHLLVSISFS